MNWDTILLLICVNIAQADHDLVLNKIIRIMNQRKHGATILRVPESPEDLPEADPMVPGHTLIQPKTGMLKSSVQFPHDSAGNAVYGNLGQLSITYGKTPHRILYTGFRKTSSLLDSTIRQAIRNIQRYNGNNKDTDVIVIESRASYEKPNLDSSGLEPMEELISDEENNAGEVLDESLSLESEEAGLRRTNTRYKYRNRDKLYAKSSSEIETSVSTSSSESSDYDKNPGNPYTLHKGKYKQNYLWNHYMDGDHINVNPFGPSLNVPGPSGVDLFFGRKWWYFNQDDFKPLR